MAHRWREIVRQVDLSLYCSDNEIVLLIRVHSFPLYAGFHFLSFSFLVFEIISAWCNLRKKCGENKNQKIWKQKTMIQIVIVFISKVSRS